MGWKQYARSAAAAGRRSERAAIKRHRELVKQYQLQQKLAERERAANEVALFENYLEVLVSVHKDGGESWDWNTISVAPAPSEPVRSTLRENVSSHVLERFK